MLNRVKYFLSLDKDEGGALRKSSEISYEPLLEEEEGNAVVFQRKRSKQWLAPFLSGIVFAFSVGAAIVIFSKLFLRSSNNKRFLPKC